MISDPVCVLFYTDVLRRPAEICAWMCASLSDKIRNIYANGSLCVQRGNRNAVSLSHVSDLL